jgi:hypothetical protein
MKKSGLYSEHFQVLYLLLLGKNFFLVLKRNKGVLGMGLIVVECLASMKGSISSTEGGANKTISLKIIGCLMFMSIKSVQFHCQRANF